MGLTFKLLFLVCLLPLAHSIPVNVNEVAEDPDPNLLPKNLIPNHYFVTLTVDVSKAAEKIAKYTGNVQIAVKPTEDITTGSIQLHSWNNIRIDTAKKTLVKDGDEANLLDADDKGTYVDATNILTLKLAKDTTLNKDVQYILNLDFDADHRDDMNGFYRSSYVDKQQKTHYLFTTQGESVAMRSAFPCFDEPGLKALFDIQINVENSQVALGYHVLSNTPLKETKPNGDYVTYIFETTPEKIATYLIAFIVSDFTSSTPAYFNEGLVFKTWGQDRYISNMEYKLSQKSGPAVLDILYKKLGIPFRFPKIDQAGIPDFSAGAMENWGLVTYRERMLFFDDEKNSVSTKQSTVGVISHELAHQWFGDLVTLHFWDDIWLNEGFANFFEYHASAEIDVDGVDAVNWNYIGQFVVDELQGGAFETDGLSTTRPMTDHVTQPDLIENNFDNIAYSKGGSVIRMWMHVLGEKNFYTALNKYLTENQGGNGTPEKLLQAFEDVYNEANPNAKLEIKTLFETWHKVAGYPVLNVQNVDKNKYNVTQERFLWKVDVAKEEPVYVWDIPITISTKESPTFDKTAPTVWLNKKDTNGKEIVVGKADDAKPTWIIVNNQETGYYRVNYDEANWKALATQLTENSSAIHEFNRAQIIDDALSLARSTSGNYLSYNIALDLTKYLKNEQDYIPWAAASNAFSFLNNKLSDKNAGYFKDHVKSLVADRYKELGLDVSVSDSHITRLLRIIISSWACKLGHEDCVAAAKQQFADNKIAPDVKSIVYCTAVRNGDDDTWEKVWDQYQKSDNNLDQTIFLSALGCSKNEEKLNKLLNETIKVGGLIKQQDVSSAFSAVYTGNPENVKVALEFLSNNLEDIADKYGGMNPIGKLLVGLANRVILDADRASLNETLETIINSNNAVIQVAIKSAQSAQDVLDATKFWIEHKRDELSKYFDNSPSNGGGDDDDDGDGGAAEITISIMTIVSCLALLFSY